MFTCSVDVDNADNDELAKKYGVRTAAINLWKKDVDTKWSIGMNIVNSLIVVMGFVVSLPQIDGYCTT